MTKRLLAIYLVLVVLLVAMVPSCGGGTGTINVEATLCGPNSPWTGNVSYMLTPESGSPINGNNVSASFNVTTGNWTCGNISGGPAGAFLVNITPSATHSVSVGGNITFTLNFEINQDAWITLLPPTWSINGSPVSGAGSAVPCNIIDAHFQQGVNGCQNYSVTLNETSWLSITQAPIGAPAATIYVVNATCAVNKTPAPLQKLSQVPSINDQTAQVGANMTLTIGVPTTLDVETQWQLSRNTTYLKTINWFGISMAPFDPQNPPHPCVLFELVLPGSGLYVFTLQTSAMVALVGDVNSQNNSTGWSPALTLVVNVP
jgi:hypothetical protein